MSKSRKVIFVVGGGSGGHLTPLVSVARALKRADDTVNIVFIGQHGENLREIVEDESIYDHATIHAGKFRRYHGESVWQHLRDFKTLALNFRDLFRFIRGTIEAVLLIQRFKPDAVFLKGGFVSVPVGIAARLRGVPYITHDSDAVPGLANRLTAKRAVMNTTALPIDGYPYDKSKTRQVGIPIQDVFRKVDVHGYRQARANLQIPDDATVIVSVGGGLGAQVINRALAEQVHSILNNRSRILFHLTGKKLFDETKKLYEKQQISDGKRARLHLIDFTTELYLYTAAADVVISRAGATNIAELASQGKLSIIIPAPHLTGGQQLHNAKILEKNQAAVVLQEKDIQQLSDKIDDTLSLDESEKQMMIERIEKLAIPHASEKIADILLKL